MPQHICSECRKQLHQMYLFVEQVQQCNAELSKRLGFTVSESNDETQDAELSHKIDESIDVHKQQSENQDFFEVSMETANSTRDGVEENNYEAMKESEIETQENVDKTSLYSVDANKVYSDCNNDQEKAHRNILTEDELETMSIENTIQMILADDSDESHSSKILTSSDRTNIEINLKLQKTVRRYEDKTKAIFTCVFCCLKFNDNQSLNVHHTVDCKVSSKENVYTIENGHFKCRQCEFSTKSLTAFYLHKLSKHSTEEAKNKCKFCSYINSNKFEMVIHIKELHLSDIKALRLNLEKEEIAR